MVSKSEASKTWRISISYSPPGTGSGQRSGGVEWAVVGEGPGLFLAVRTGLAGKSDEVGSGPRVPSSSTDTTPTDPAV
jgi:hypothetical protein